MIRGLGFSVHVHPRGVARYQLPFVCNNIFSLQLIALGEEFKHDVIALLVTHNVNHDRCDVCAFTNKHVVLFTVQQHMWTTNSYFEYGRVRKIQVESPTLVIFEVCLPFTFHLPSFSPSPCDAFLCYSSISTSNSTAAVLLR